MAWASCPCPEVASNHGRDARATLGRIGDQSSIGNCPRGMCRDVKCLAQTPRDCPDNAGSLGSISFRRLKKSNSQIPVRLTPVQAGANLPTSPSWEEQKADRFYYPPFRLRSDNCVSIASPTYPSKASATVVLPSFRRAHAVASSWLVSPPVSLSLDHTLSLKRPRVDAECLRAHNSGIQFPRSKPSNYIKDP